MRSRTAELGRCPRCGASIPRIRALIEYDTIEGRATYAECPECRAVVHPDSTDAGPADGGIGD